MISINYEGKYMRLPKIRHMETFIHRCIHTYTYASNNHFILSLYSFKNVPDIEIELKYLI